MANLLLPIIKACFIKKLLIYKPNFDVKPFEGQKHRSCITGKGNRNKYTLG